MSFFLKQEFFTPFLSTVAASITVLILGAIHQVHSEQRKKLYAVSYMAKVGCRILQTSLILRRNTIHPHVEAIKRILSGDQELMRTMFLADEFDIMNDEGIEFNDLPDEHKILVGYDDLDLTQNFEFLLSLDRNAKMRDNLNEFVKENLKSPLEFLKKNPEERVEALSTYKDYLDRFDHGQKRSIAFVAYILLPCIKDYANRWSFLIYSKRNITEQFELAKTLKKANAAWVPGPDFFHKSISGGIQKIVRNPPPPQE